MRERRKHHEDFIKERRTGADRRAYARTRVAITMELTAGNDLYFHVSADLSEGGAFFNRAIPHPIGTRVSLTFQLPGDERGPIRCQGEVANIPEMGEGLGMGVRFVELPEDDRDRILAFNEKIEELTVPAHEEPAAEAGEQRD